MKLNDFTVHVSDLISTCVDLSVTGGCVAAAAADVATDGGPA